MSAALIGLVGLGALCWWLHIVTADGADPWLFKGGFLLCGAASLLLIAAVTHRRTAASRVLAAGVLLWIGTRSYGLYLYHWPIYQIIREVSGRPLSVAEFVVALAISAVVTEISFRIIETPIRRGTFGRWWRRLQAARDPAPRRVIAGAGACLVAVSVFAVTSLATAELKPNEIAQSLDEASEANTAIEELLDPEAATDTVETIEPSDPSSPVVVVSTTLPPGMTVPSTAPTTSTSTTTTTTLPPGPPPPLALGDSVMLGAADELADEGIVVSAEVSRQMKSMVPVVQQLRDEGRLGDDVIVHLGTNGDLSDETVSQFFGALTGVRQVLVLTVLAPGKGWIAPNNEKLVALPAQFPNVKVLYWDGLAAECPGACFYGDGIHLTQAGQDYYTQLIMSQLTA